MDTLTIGECAKLLGVNEQTVRRMVDRGDIAGVRLADEGWRRIPRQEIVALAQRRNLEIDWTVLEHQ
jgi:excisionase family DNA binding protein